MNRHEILKRIRIDPQICGGNLRRQAVHSQVPNLGVTDPRLPCERFDI